MIADTMISEYVFSDSGSGDDVETIGDRVLEILRRCGRRDMGAPYEQHELVAMLNGDRIAPDGRRYVVPNANKSTVSKMINDNQRWQVDMIIAICAMFDQDANWLLTGERRAATTPEPPKISEIATEAGALVDALDTDLRDSTMAFLRSLRTVDNERRTLQHNYADMLALGANDSEQIRARSVFSKVDSR